MPYGQMNGALLNRKIHIDKRINPSKIYCSRCCYMSHITSQCNEEHPKCNKCKQSHLTKRLPISTTIITHKIIQILRTTSLRLSMWSNISQMDSVRSHKSIFNTNEKHNQWQTELKQTIYIKSTFSNNELIKHQYWPITIRCKKYRQYTPHSNRFSHFNWKNNGSKLSQN